MRTLHCICAMLIVVAIGACTAASSDSTTDSPGTAPTSTREQLQRLHDAIKAEIGTPTAANAGQCRAIAFGAKPCGGPWTYLIYSTAVSNETKLQQLVAEYNALDRKRNAEEGLASDCALVEQPEVTVRDGVCAAGR